MAEERKDSFAETVDTAASAAHTVKGAIKAGKAISGAAKGAAAGGPYGAVAGAVWAGRKHIGKIVAVIVILLLLPVLFVLMLPGLIFGGLINAFSPADTEQPDETETRLQTEITAAETGVTVHSAGNASAAAESSTVPAEDEIVSPVSPEITVPQKPQQQETQPVVTTAAPQTTAAATTVPKAETTAAPETVTEPPATTASSMETVPIRQNIYLYYKLTWEGNPYDTDYMEVSSSSLDQYLGYGVTRGNDVEDTYTVLIYSIVGVDPVQQVAVQYAGEEKYYVFTIQ